MIESMCELIRRNVATVNVQFHLTPSKHRVSRF